MRIYVKVSPRAGKNEIVKISDAKYKVKVTTPPEEGRANKAVIDLLANHFKVPKSLVKIVSGKMAKTKVIDIAFLERIL